MSLSFSWQAQTYTNAAKLESACQQYHHAAQFLAALSQSLLPAAEDDSHTNLEWIAPRHGLATRWINDSFRLVLDYPRFALRLENREEKPLAELMLDGHTKSSVLAWLREESNRITQGITKVEMIEHYTLPDHPLDQEDAIFQAPTDELREELRRYRANIASALQAVPSSFAVPTSEVRTWPHHFDSAVLMEVSRNESGALTASVGVGLAMPDDITKGFYYYVSPWRKDGNLNTGDLPELEMGAWNPEGFTGAVLELPRLALIHSDTQQKAILESFLLTAIESAIQQVKG